MIWISTKTLDSLESVFYKRLYVKLMVLMFVLSKILKIEIMVNKGRLSTLFDIESKIDRKQKIREKKKEKRKKCKVSYKQG